MTRGQVDPYRSAPLGDVGLPGYEAVTAIGMDGDERLVLASSKHLGTSTPHTLDWRTVAPHELTGPLPRAFAPKCGRRGSASAKPCRNMVAHYGDACTRHQGMADNEADRHALA